MPSTGRIRIRMIKIRKNKMTRDSNLIPYLTNEMIELQAQNDLRRFQQLSGKPLSFPIYPDEILLAVWGIEVEYLDEVVDPSGESVLACFVSEKKTVYVNNSLRGSEGRVSYTIAHETGHVSLHNFLTKIRTKNDQENNMLEKQADKYASFLLIPQDSLIRELKKMDYQFFAPLDLTLCANTLLKVFGVSHQALERRLTDLGIQTTGGLYCNKLPKTADRHFEEKEKERQSWSLEKQKRDPRT